MHYFLFVIFCRIFPEIKSISISGNIIRYSIELGKFDIEFASYVLVIIDEYVTILNGTGQVFFQHILVAA